MSRKTLGAGRLDRRNQWQMLLFYALCSFLGVATTVHESPQRGR
jgi:hypothetical protein